MPSQALEHGTTFDLHVLDISAKWARHQQEKSQTEQSGGTTATITPKMSVEEMQAMIARVKERK